MIIVIGVLAGLVMAATMALVTGLGLERLLAPRWRLRQRRSVQPAAENSGHSADTEDAARYNDLMITVVLTQTGPRR